MATKTYVTVEDDLDGSTEGVANYHIIDPRSGRTHEIDLSAKNFDTLVEALAPFLEKSRPWRGGVMSVTADRAKSASKAKRDDYDPAALKEWATAEGRWTGKRPSFALIDDFLQSRAGSGSTG